MGKSTIIGLVLGFLAVGAGMVFKGASLTVLWNPAAILIIFVGTAASICIAFPMTELKKIPKLLKIIFREPKLIPKNEIIQVIVSLAITARREGLLAIENEISKIDDPFLRSSMQLVIDGYDPALVKNLLLEEIHAHEERHRSGALIFTQAGTYAPTLGVLGAVIGLIAALGNLSDIEKLGHSIAAAFVATLLGIFSGYVLWHPIANRLKRMSKKEMENKEMVVEGVLAIQAGYSPSVIEQMLRVYLTTSERLAKDSPKGVINNEQTQGAA